MYQVLLADTRFHELLLTFDNDSAEEVRHRGCHCGGKLHSARYRRKPRGLPAGLNAETYSWRFSFCCAIDGCRERTTPPSVRFFGPRVYLAPMVVLISAMLYGATDTRMARLSQLFRVSRRTVARWRLWWRTTFMQSRFWSGACAAFMPPLDPDRLPASLLERFRGGDTQRLLAMLCFLGPITGGSAVHA